MMRFHVERLLARLGRLLERALTEGGSLSWK